MHQGELRKVKGLTQGHTPGRGRPLASTPGLRRAPRDAAARPTLTPALQDRSLLPLDCQLPGPCPAGSAPDQGPDLLGRDPSPLNEPFISVTEIKASVILRGDPRGGKGHPGIGLLPCPRGSSRGGHPRRWASPVGSTLPVTLAPPSNPQCLTLQLSKGRTANGADPRKESSSRRENAATGC